jgi:two-component system phosphate regulon sensor histidine kinase PhoR
MHRLVMDLLVLARLDAGTADLQRAQVDLTGLLKAVIEKFSLQAQNASITLLSQFGDLPMLIGDGDRLAQVFTNLVDNALKYTPAGGQVSINAGVDQGTIVISVADNGAGIAPQDLQRIFERFYQVDKSRRGGSGRGVGLGLAIASQIVQAHQGQIWVQSTPGSGSTFYVRLPIAYSNDPTLNPHRGG